MARLFNTSRYPIGIDDENEDIGFRPSVAITPDNVGFKERDTDAVPLGGKAPITATPVSAAPMPAARTPISNPKFEADQAELQRLQKSGSGIDQLTHPVDEQGNPDTTKHPGFFKKLGSVAARIGDVAGSAFFPGVMANIPGTTLHHDVLVNQQRGRVADDLSDAQTQAQTHNLEMEPEFKQAKLDAEHQKLINSLASHGQKLDDKGNVVDDEDSAIYQSRKLHDDYFQARKDFTDAQTEYEKTKNNPNNPQYLLAAARLKQAEERMKITARLIDVQQQRVNVMRDNYNLHATGTNSQGEALPGAMLDDNDNPIGTAFQTNVRPTGQQRGKANLAESADEQLADMKEIVQKRPDIFGPAAGRKTDFTVWVGSQDPDAQKFRAARTIAGDHLAGVFGGRSESALSKIDEAIGHYKDNPQAIIAGLDQLSKANKSFEKAGTVRTVGSKKDTRGKPNNSAPKAGDVVDGYKFKGGDPSKQENWEKQ